MKGKIVGLLAVCAVFAAEAAKLPQVPRPSEKYAAEEYAAWTAKLTGGKAPELEIVRDDALGEDGFRLRNVGGRLVVAGGRRGVLYGVYEALERFGGIEWLAVGTTVVPANGAFRLPEELDEVQKPAFELREPLWYDVMHDADLTARMKLNPSQLQERHGGCSHRFDSKLRNCHTFEWLVPQKDYWKEHPEYYSEWEGKRLKGKTQLCLTNPDVLRIVTEKVLQRIEANPRAKYFGISQNDWGFYCTCTNCAAVDAEEESHAGTVIRFVNAVADEVAKRHPDKVIETLAYQWSRKPPKKTRVRANVMPCLCSIECEFKNPLATSEFAANRSLMDDLSGWAAQTDQLYVWDYTTDYANYLYPFPNVLVLQENIRTFRANKVKFLFEQGAYQGRHADFAELKTWLIAKWMWNPDLPLEPLLKRFFDGYYGAAAGTVRRYFDMLHALPRKGEAGNPLCIYESAYAPSMTDDFLERASRLWDEAERLVKDDPVRSYNVRMGRLPVDVTRLLRHRDVAKRWPEYRALAERTLAAFGEAKTIRLSEAAKYDEETLSDWRKMSACATFADAAKDLSVDTFGKRNPSFAMNRFLFEAGKDYALRVHVRGGGFEAGVNEWDSDRSLGKRKVEAKNLQDGWAWYDVFIWRASDRACFWFHPLDEKTEIDRVMLVPCVDVAELTATVGETRYLAADGDDAANGKTPATAWRTLEKASEALPGGATLRMKCGDVFYGQLRPATGLGAENPTVVTSWGVGPKPVISATKNLRRDPSVWQNLSHCRWRVNLAGPTNCTGIVTEDCNPGFLLVDGEVKAWRRYCRDDVVSPWDFCGEDGWLHVHAPKNPALLAKDIRVALNVHGVFFRSHTVISNIAVRATGAHGMVGGWNADSVCEDVRISDCDFDNIGGSELPHYSKITRVRYGNGVEFGSNCRSAVVERCTFKGTYDVAVTMQGYPTLTSWSDIHVRNCTMTDCTQAFEVWCGKTPKGYGFERCSFTGNRTLRVGGGWGPVVRPDRACATPLLVYGMDTDTVDITVSGNTFEDAPWGLLYKSGGLDKLPAGYRIRDNVLRRVAAQKPALVLRFDDNKTPQQWQEIAEIFEAIGGRCSFAVNPAWLSEEQWAKLRELSARGHEIMDHTPQHAIFKLEHDGKIDLYRPEVDLAHAGNVRVQASMTNGVLRSEDPAFIKVQRASLKFFVPSTGKFYGLGTDCGPKLKESAEQKCSDFWGRWTKDSFERCEVVLLDDMAVQPSLELLRAQARESVASFKAHELPPPKTWIRPGGWEGPVDWRRMKAVYGDEFGYKIVDSSGGEGLEPYSQWNYSSDFGFFDFVPDVEKVYAKAVAALERGHSFAYISHQWTKDRAKYLDQCRQLAAKLKAGGIRMTTYSHIAE